MYASMYMHLCLSACLSVCMYAGLLLKSGHGLLPSGFICELYQVNTIQKPVLSSTHYICPRKARRHLIQCPLNRHLVSTIATFTIATSQTDPLNSKPQLDQTKTVSGGLPCRQSERGAPGGFRESSPCSHSASLHAAGFHLKMLKRKTPLGCAELTTKHLVKNHMLTDLKPSEWDALCTAGTEGAERCPQGGCINQGARHSSHPLTPKQADASGHRWKSILASYETEAMRPQQGHMQPKSYCDILGDCQAPRTDVRFWKRSTS